MFQFCLKVTQAESPKAVPAVANPLVALENAISLSEVEPFDISGKSNIFNFSSDSESFLSVNNNFIQDFLISVADEEIDTATDLQAEVTNGL